jgi:hypothetical protein
MNKSQATQYFDVDEFRAWLANKQISFKFSSDKKLVCAVELAKLNPDKIPQLEMHIGAFLHESLYGSQPESAAQDEAKGPVTLPDYEPIKL